MKIALFTNLDVIENNDNIFSVIKSLIKNKIEFEIDINSKISKSALQSANIDGDNIKNFVELNDSYDFAVSVGGDGTILNSTSTITVPLYFGSSSSFYIFECFSWFLVCF